MSFKDKVNDAIKEGNLDRIADLSNVSRSQNDKEWLEHGGPFGTPVFGNIDGNGNGTGSYSELIHEGYTVEGDARRPTLIILIDGAIKRKKKNQALESVKDFCKEWNQRCCKPEPLSDQEFEECWNEVLNRKEQESEQNKQFYNDFFDNQTQEQTQEQKDTLEELFPELKGNIHYRNNIRPAKFIVALRGINHLVEIEASIQRSWDKEANLELECTTKHNKTFLICIPTEIKRHLNPFMHLEPEDAAPKYSISFVDSTGERHKFPHKTLAGIIGNLKDLGYVSGDGAENALGTILLGFKKMEKIVDNNDVDVEGFFIDKVTKQITASKIDIKDPKGTNVLDALNFIDEITKYYRGRRDLLATSLVWGMVAPIIFILKTTDYYLEFLYLYGASNAFKTSDGRIILAIDGHHDDPNYSLKLTHINTVPRFGNKISKSTFPLLIDEVDLNVTANIKDKEKENLINAIKIAVDSKIVRQKFENSTDTDMIPIPALSPLILTSEHPPPTHYAGFMKRVRDRHFPQSESKSPNDQESIDCKEFMRTNLGRLRSLGNFRNWYVMNHQDYILDDKRKPPLDLGFEILTKAYEYVGKEVPIWLSLRLPQNQLEQAVQDNALLVKHAFIKYINDRYGKAVSIWKAASHEFGFQEDVSYRLKQLGISNLITDVKIKIETKDGIEGFRAIIGRGILEEIYDKGISHDQCPNLRQLADYMGVGPDNYRKIHGCMKIDADCKTLFEYFDDGELGVEPNV